MNKRDIFNRQRSAAGPIIVGGLSAGRAPGAVDGMKPPILAGGDFAAMSSKLASKLSGNPAVTSFAKLEIQE